ncbi:MAG TPA: efflux RND transporter periplasmic adaptor subunit, partial [Caldithrix abyssi]|nr:efflux RND transporter periplasmic adaptor subunit [Caldithrix abyssi]
MKTLLLFVMFTMLIAGCSSPEQNSTAAREQQPPPSIIRDAGEGRSGQIRLSPEQVNTLKIKTFTADTARVAFPLSIPAVAEAAPDYLSIISAPIEGIINKIYAHEGDRVKKGQLIMEMESLEFARILGDFFTSEANLRFSAEQLERVKQLYAKKIKSKKELQEANTQYIQATTARNAYRAQLNALGITEADLQTWRQQSSLHAHLPIRSAIDGIISEHMADLGQAVQRYQRLGKIINNGMVLVRGYAAPEDGIFIRRGVSAVVSRRSDPQTGITTSVHSYVPALDEQNRSIVVITYVGNPPEWLSPGRNVRLTLMARPDQPVISIPARAVIDDGNKKAVFVR